jgi:antitoxin CptB
MIESRDIMIKRLSMRAMRRGMKEMDIILSGFADRQLADMTDAELQHFDALLSENDQDLYQWVSGQAAAKPEFQGLLDRIRQDTLNAH